MNPTQKITESHLRRAAYLYVRQSTMHQVFENTESRARQYALRQRATSLGWSIEQVVVIDSDLGKSGASAADRQGFQKLMGEVGMGRAGLVMGLEVSRLARNSADWHRLLEICALSDTLILDEDGLYDPNQFNDRLLLGLKGTMSEAELHLLRSRLQGGIRNKASRGELQTPLPVGLVYTDQGQVALDPDRQVQQTIHFFFRTFDRIGTAWGTVKAFRREGARFPRRLRKGPRKGELHWDELRLSRALQMLHNPRYAGAFFYGRTRTRKAANGKAMTRGLPPDQWQTLIRDKHVGYIDWERYEDNLRILRESARAHGADRRRSPPREGPALLQGLILCGRCGQRMTVRYRTRRGQLSPEYLCQRGRIERCEPICQSVMGAGLDQAVGDLLVQAVTPMTLEVALSVQQELQTRLEEADHLRRQRVERARYEAELAQRRFMKVDPANRLVADALEADWNKNLRILSQAQEEYERQSRADRAVLSEEKRRQILALAADFPRLWRNPKTPQRDRKRMVRLLIEDVTLIRDKQISAHIRFKGGKTQTLCLPLPQPTWKTWQTPPEVIREIDRLLEDHTDGEIARILAERGLRPGKGGAFNGRIVARLRKRHGLSTRYERLRAKGLLTKEEIARKLNVGVKTVQIWRDHGLLTGQATNARNTYLYDWPQQHPPAKMQGQKLTERRAAAAVLPQGTKEAQYEA